jgi:hypothetical protein
MKYIEKAIMTATGVEATAWIAIDLSAQLWRQSRAFNDPQPGKIMLLGWKDITALMEMKAPMETKPYDVADISQLASYGAMMTELVTDMVSDAGSPFYGGAVKETPATPYPPVPEE